MQNLSVTLIQPNLFWQNEKDNLDNLYKLIQKTPQADIIVLPEMFSTGFSMQPEGLAQSEAHNLVWLRKVSKERNSVVCGSLMTEENGLYYNRLYWVNPDGSYLSYNKKHLFTMTGEEKVYQAGKEKLIVQVKGWKICPMICFDLRFPVFIRNKEDYDVLLFVANWPERRAQHWRVLVQARAIENQCFTIGVNRVGEDGNGINHIGDSMLVAPNGNIMAHIAYEEGFIHQVLNYDEIVKTRRYMPFLKEMDSFSLE